jgi:hypothetical protein
MSAIYYVKGAYDSLWRRADGDPNMPPNEVLCPEGWQKTVMMDAGAWLTNCSTLRSVDDARDAAREVGLPPELVE